MTSVACRRGARAVRSTAIVALLLVFVVSVGFFAPLRRADAFFGTGRRGAANSDDLYAVLGVTKRASSHDIKKAFRQKTREVHPDLKESAEEKEAAKVEMAKILRAYEVLSDDEKRVHYDRFGVIPGEAGAPPAGQPGRGGPPGFEHMHGFPFFFHGFEGQQQQAQPITSKTPTLRGVSEFRDLMEWSRRSRGVVLVQAYHKACAQCRWFSPTWENVANSGWAYGAVRMFRVAVDEDGEEVFGMMGGGNGKGFSILKEAGVSYGPAPVVFAVAGGSVYPMTSLADTLIPTSPFSGPPQGPTQRALYAFVRSFFVDSSAVTALSSATTGASPVDIMRQLEQSAMAQFHRRNSHPTSMDFALWVSSNIESDIATSLCVHRPHAVCSSVEPKALLSLLSHCGISPTGPGGQRARDSDALYMLVTVPLAALSRNAAGARAGAAWCPFVKVASSNSPLSPVRAQKFVDQTFDVKISRSANHAGASSGSGTVTIPFMDFASFTSICVGGRRGCVVLVSHNCSSHPRRQQALVDLPAALEAAVEGPLGSTSVFRRSDILEDVSPLTSGLLCLDSEPRVGDMLLRAAFAASHRSLASKASLDGAFLIAVHQEADATDGSSPRSLLLLPQTLSQDHPQLVSQLPSTLQEFIADVLEATASYGSASSHKLRPAWLTTLELDHIPEATAARDATAAVAYAFVSPTFEVSWWRPIIWRAAQYGDVAASLGSFAPLVVLWLVLRYCFGLGGAGGRGADAAARDGAQRPAHQRAEEATNRAPPRPSSSSTANVVKRCPVYGVPYLSSADLRNAETGKGFLVLIYDATNYENRAAAASLVTLPRVLVVETRFTVRVVESTHKMWWQWLDELLAASSMPTRSASGGTAFFVAIRMGKLLACVKPAHTTTSEWATELLLGMAVPLHPLPK